MSNKMKKAIRARMAKTGETYSTARMHILSARAAENEGFSAPASPGRGLSKLVRALLDQRPDISSNGLRTPTTQAAAFEAGRADLRSPQGVREVEDCMAFLELLPKARTAKPRDGRRSRSSYGMKHEVERWLRRDAPADRDSYISNGAFIVAALLAGFPTHREDATSPNALIGVDDDDVKALAAGHDPRTWKKKSSFVRWLFKQTERSDIVGDLATDCQADFEFPRTGNVSVIRDYLSEYGEHVVDALDQARGEYLASRKT